MVALFFFIASPAGVLAAENDVQQANLCAGAKLSIGSNGKDGIAGCKSATDIDGSSANQLELVVKRIVNIVTLIVGIIAVIMIIVGGFRYVTSGGDSGKTASARNTVVYALVGLIVVVFAQIIVKFALGIAN